MGKSLSIFDKLNEQSGNVAKILKLNKQEYDDPYNFRVEEGHVYFNSNDFEGNKRIFVGNNDEAEKICSNLKLKAESLFTINLNEDDECFFCLETFQDNSQMFATTNGFQPIHGKCKNKLMQGSNELQQLPAGDLKNFIMYKCQICITTKTISLQYSESTDL